MLKGSSGLVVVPDYVPVNARPTGLSSLYRGPWHRGRGYAKLAAERLDSRVQVLEEQVLWDSGLLQGKTRLEGCSNTRCPLAVAKHSLDAADQERLVVTVATASAVLQWAPEERTVDGLGLNRISRRRTCPVSLKVLRPVARVGWVQPGLTIRLTDQGSLCLRAGPLTRSSSSAWARFF